MITCSPFSDTHGKGWARLGDMVACPRCGGVFPIAQGDASLLDDGKPVAYNGCKTACGAALISGQMFTFTTPSAGSDNGAATSEDKGGAMDGFGLVSAALASRYQDEPEDTTDNIYRGRFQLIGALTGAPVAGRSVRVRSTDGQYDAGTTDEQGFTQWVQREAREALAFDLIPDDKP